MDEGTRDTLQAAALGEVINMWGEYLALFLCCHPIPSSTTGQTATAVGSILDCRTVPKLFGQSTAYGWWCKTTLLFPALPSHKQNPENGSKPSVILSNLPLKNQNLFGGWALWRWRGESCGLGMLFFACLLWQSAAQLTLVHAWPTNNKIHTQLRRCFGAAYLSSAGQSILLPHLVLLQPCCLTTQLELHLLRAILITEWKQDLA